MRPPPYTKDRHPSKGRSGRGGPPLRRAQRLSSAKQPALKAHIQVTGYGCSGLCLGIYFTYQYIHAERTAVEKGHEFGGEWGGAHMEGRDD